MPRIFLRKIWESVLVSKCKKSKKLRDMGIGESKSEVKIKRNIEDQWGINWYKLKRQSTQNKNAVFKKNRFLAPYQNNLNLEIQ